MQMEYVEDVTQTVALLTYYLIPVPADLFEYVSSFLARLTSLISIYRLFVPLCQLTDNANDTYSATLDPFLIPLEKYPRHRMTFVIAQ